MLMHLQGNQQLELNIDTLTPARIRNGSSVLYFFTALALAIGVVCLIEWSFMVLLFFLYGGRHYF